MRSPARTIAGHLMWTRTGSVWAIWRLTPLPYGYRPTKEKFEARALHQALIRALPGESLLLGVCAGLDSAAIVERMIDGVDLSECPDWAEECNATLDTLDEIGIGQRIYWLAVPLSDASGKDRAAESFRAATADLRDLLGMPRTGVPAKEITRRVAQAKKIAEGIPAPFRPTPATAAQLVWLHLHAQQRGMFADVTLPETPGDVAAQLLTPRSGAALTEPLLDEGGQSDLDRKSLRAWNPIERRYLKVSQPHAVAGTAAASYQSLLVLSDVPDDGMTFPGSEFLGRLDECGLEVDWAMRLTVRSSDQIARQNRKALNDLNEQFTQREGELSHGLNTLDRAAADLAEYAKVLDSDKLEVEAQATIVFAVASASAETTVEQARKLADYFGAAGYKLQQPLGYQEDLWWSMIPGAPANKAVREFAQITTARALSATVPLASTELGDSGGSLLGVNISTGRPGAVLHDIAGASRRDISGSIGIAGELGAGKALAIDTPIPTPSGWTTMGTLTAGDRVLDETGHPTVVTAVSPVMHARECFEVIFSDGSALIADAEHLWTTLPRRVREQQAKLNYKRRLRGAALIDLVDVTAQLTGPEWHQHGYVTTTRDIAGSLLANSQANHAIPVAMPLELPEADLPIAPYVLGAWLGDGSSRSAQLTSADPEVLTHIELAGYTITKRAHPYAYGISLQCEIEDEFTPHHAACGWCSAKMRVTYPSRRYCSRMCSGVAKRVGVHVPVTRKCNRCGHALPVTSTGRRCTRCRSQSTLIGRLRSLSVVKNKHVPAAYLRASIDQRRALLAGLLDTDGTVTRSGTVEFTNTNERLARDVFELVCSLGYRTTLRQGRARLHGRDCGAKWTIAFTTTEQVFLLSRKQIAQSERAANVQPSRHRYRYIAAVRPVPSVPVRCISVAAASSLFLAGRSMIPTHNSVLQKKLAGDVVDRGGQIIVPDRTAMGEWAHWAASVTKATVVDIADPVVSLDPLRMYGPVVGSRITQSFLTPLLNVSPTSERGVLLADVLDPEYLAAHRLTGLGDLLAHLEDGCTLAGASDLARVMRVFARRDFGRVIFDNSLAPLTADAPAIIIRTHTLELPNREELHTPHLFEQMRLEKIFGRATYALTAGLARQICFSDRSRLGMFVVDEAHHLTSSPEGEREIIDFVRDGRKHQAAVILGSHDPEADFGSDTLRGLIPTRIQMRQRDKTLAKKGLKWLDMDSEDDELLEMLVADTSPVGPNGVEEWRRGEAFIRDSSGNIGRLKVLAPSVLERNKAVRTSPPELRKYTS
ncbi:MAG: ATP-binding protein [Nocardioides sp.]